MSSRSLLASLVPWLFLLVTVFLTMMIWLLHLSESNLLTCSVDGIRIDEELTSRLRERGLLAQTSRVAYMEQEELFFAYSHTRFDKTTFGKLVNNPEEFTMLDIDITVRNKTPFSIKNLCLVSDNQQVFWTRKGFVTDDYQIEAPPNVEMKMKCRLILYGKNNEVQSMIQDPEKLNLSLDGNLFFLRVCSKP